MQGFYNSLFFLNYLCSYGLNLNDNPNILELFQSAGCSLSQHLVNNNQFLLSNKVKYDELDSKGITGALGYLNESGNIYVPKTIENDDRFLYTSAKSLYKKHSYGIPTIDEFNTIIGYFVVKFLENRKNELFYSLINNSDINQYFCFSVDRRKFINSAKLIASYYELVKMVNDGLGKNIYTFEHDTAFGKDYCLIKRGK